MVNVVFASTTEKNGTSRFRPWKSNPASSRQFQFLYFFDPRKASFGKGFVEVPKVILEILQGFPLCPVVWKVVQITKELSVIRRTLYCCSPYLFVMSPQSQHFHYALRFEHFVDKSVLNIDSSGICTHKIADELLVGGRILERIIGQNIQ